MSISSEHPQLLPWREQKQMICLLEPYTVFLPKGSDRHESRGPLIPAPNLQETEDGGISWTAPCVCNQKPALRKVVQAKLPGLFSRGTATRRKSWWELRVKGCPKPDLVNGQIQLQVSRGTCGSDKTSEWLLWKGIGGYFYREGRLGWRWVRRGPCGQAAEVLD